MFSNNQFVFFTCKYFLLSYPLFLLTAFIQAANLQPLPLTCPSPTHIQPTIVPTNFTQRIFCIGSLFSILAITSPVQVLLCPFSIEALATYLASILFLFSAFKFPYPQINLFEVYPLVSISPGKISNILPSASKCDVLWAELYLPKIHVLKS